MSHIVEIKTRLTDLAAIKEACKSIGCQFVEGQTSYKWWGVSVGDYPLPQGFKNEDIGKCDHAIKVPGTSWEVGVVRARNADGTPAEGYTLLCDFFGPKGYPIAKAFGGTFHELYPIATGMTFHRFLQAYGVAKATIEAKKKGYMVRQQPGKNGSIQLVVTGF